MITADDDAVFSIVAVACHAGTVAPPVHEIANRLRSSSRSVRRTLARLIRGKRIVVVGCAATRFYRLPDGSESVPPGPPVVRRVRRRADNKADIHRDYYPVPLLISDSEMAAWLEKGRNAPGNVDVVTVFRRTVPMPEKLASYLPKRAIC